MSDSIRWLPMDPQETDELVFDFRVYAKGRAITDLTVDVEVMRGTDAQASTRAVGLPLNTDGEVLQMFGHPVDGVIYKIRCRALFEDTREHVLVGVLPCERK